MTRKRLFAAVFVLAAAAALAASTGSSPASTSRSAAAAGPLRFAVIGDFGTGDTPEYEVAAQAATARAKMGLDLVLLVGDNLYGSQDFVAKFERPFKSLLDARVPFYAALGNHDSQVQLAYPAFNMRGQRYYTFSKSGVGFFVLDTNLLDPKQLDWLKRALAASNDEWLVMSFHHPLYSNAGRHGSNVDLRIVLEPILAAAGVDVAFSGHDHVYERIKPQKGITYFVAGSGGKLAKNDVQRSATTAAAFDTDQVFLVVDVDRDDMRYQAITRAGVVVDAGTIARRAKDLK
jgi:predicted MPP superfamily phosphohydrolase